MDWVADEEVIIATTDYNHRKAEVRTLTGCTTTDGKTTCTLDKPLLNRHFAGDIKITDDWT